MGLFPVAGAALGPGTANHGDAVCNTRQITNTRTIGIAATTLKATSLTQSNDNSPRVSATNPRSLATMVVPTFQNRYRCPPEGHRIRPVAAQLRDRHCARTVNPYLLRAAKIGLVRRNDGRGTDRLAGQSTKYLLMG
jgi:hypothetical protein